MPKSFSFSTEMFRQYQEQKLRNKSSGDIIIRPTFAKNWDWNRTYDFRYDITKGLNFTYNASANAYIYEPAGNPERETAEWNANRDTIKDETCFCNFICKGLQQKEGGIFDSFINIFFHCTVIDCIEKIIAFPSLSHITLQSGVDGYLLRRISLMRQRSYDC